MFSFVSAICVLHLLVAISSAQQRISLKYEVITDTVWDADTDDRIEVRVQWENLLDNNVNPFYSPWSVLEREKFLGF